MTLLQEVSQEITRLIGLALITPDLQDWYAQMAAFPLLSCDGQGLQRVLYEEYHVEVPITSWNNQSFIRVSVQAYNEPRDLEVLISGLKKLLPEYRRNSH